MQISKGARTAAESDQTETSAMTGRGRLGVVLFVLGFILCIEKGESIQCYQCDSRENRDLCPQERPFDSELNAMVDCNSFEANTPGQFCVKIYQESPGYGGWIKITRRCASRTDQGVAWGCRWSWDEVGVFKNTCYCEEDGCNAASALPHNVILAFALVILCILGKRFV